MLRFACCVLRFAALCLNAACRYHHHPPLSLLKGAHRLADGSGPRVLHCLHAGVHRVHQGRHDADVFGHHVFDFDDHDLNLGQHVQEHAEYVLNAARQIVSKFVNKVRMKFKLDDKPLMVLAVADIK